MKSQKFTLASRLILGLSLILPQTAARSQNSDSTAQITVNAAANIGAVNPLILGHNIEAADAWHIFGDTHTPSNNGEGFWDPQKRDFVPEVMKIVDKLRVGALRYPGGSLANNFNWKMAVGPLESRPNFQFGIDEYIALCRRLRAEPVMTVSDYFGTAGEAAELVEYLNAPAAAGHPWALKRAAWGHPSPYGVKWFELGNETDEGNHQMQPFRKFTSSQYVQWAREYVTKMKAVDPTIKIGVSSDATNTLNPDSDWNRLIFQKTPSFVDFIIVHTYTPSVPEDATEAQLNGAAAASMASTDNLRIRLQKYHQAIRRLSGRDLPFAITEYNVEADQERIIPYRFSFAAGLEAADFIRMCLQPETGVVMANYWQLLNGYWGMIQGVSVRAPYSFFRLWSSSLGSTLVRTDVSSPHIEFVGGFGINQAKGGSYQVSAKPKEYSLPATFPEIVTATSAVRPLAPSGVTVDFTNANGAAYPQLFTIPIEPGPGGGKEFKLSFEARVIGTSPGKAVDYGEFGMELLDGRGWDATHSAVAMMGVENADDWHTFSGVFNSLPDIKDLAVVARWATTRPFSGKMEIRNVRILLDPETYPAFPALTTTTMKSADGKLLNLVVFNKDLDHSIDTNITVNGFTAARGTFSELADPALSIAEADPRTGPVTIPKDGKFRHTFPPCSMTVISLAN
jgi:alpha-N-arabinofuranosidase